MSTRLVVYSFIPFDFSIFCKYCNSLSFFNLVIKLSDNLNARASVVFCFGDEFTSSVILEMFLYIFFCFISTYHIQ